MPDAGNSRRLDAQRAGIAVGQTTILRLEEDGKKALIVILGVGFGAGNVNLMHPSAIERVEGGCEFCNAHLGLEDRKIIRRRVEPGRVDTIEAVAVAGVLCVAEDTINL